jgi:hypothetical protein
VVGVLVRWIVLGVFLYRIATIISVALSKSLVPDEASEAYFRVAFSADYLNDEGADAANDFPAIDSSGSASFGDRHFIWSKDPPNSSVHCLAETFNATRPNAPWGPLIGHVDTIICAITSIRTASLSFRPCSTGPYYRNCTPDMFLPSASKAVMTSCCNTSNSRTHSLGHATNI